MQGFGAWLVGLCVLGFWGGSWEDIGKDKSLNLDLSREGRWVDGDDWEGEGAYIRTGVRLRCSGLRDYGLCPKDEILCCSDNAQGYWFCLKNL